MAFAPQPFVEHPNLRAPVALIVDDPAPGINPLWFFRRQVDGQAAPVYARTIPVAFMEDWCRWVGESGARGDFTILPYPAGLGRVDGTLEGFDTGETRAWMTLARENVAPQFDIHPEILTHTRALDLTTKQLLPLSEHEWTMAQDEETLAEYFAVAMQILKDAGVPNHGITQPCFFHSDESRYARALLTAEKQVNARKVTHNFLHMDSISDVVPPRLTLLDEAAGEAVVSLWTGTDDFVWNTQEPDNPDQTASPETLADRFLTADGQGGRLAELLTGGGPLVMVTHWQSLYSNGTRLGLQTHKEVAARLESLWGERIAWRKLSEIAAHFLAARTVRLTAAADENSVAVTVVCPFETDILTISIPTPWPLRRGPQVSLDGVLLPQADAARLAVNSWTMRGSVVTVSLSLVAHQRRQIAVQTVGG